MSFILFVILTVVLINLFQSPAFLNFLLIFFLVSISFLTPFWPIVLIGFYLKHQFSKDTHTEAYKRKKEMDEWN